MTKVLALVTDAYGGRGGIAQAARDLIAALAAHDVVDAIDIWPRSVLDEPKGLPRKVRQRRAISNRPVYAARTLAAALTARPDIVFCNHLYMAPLANLVAHVAGARSLVQVHGIEIWELPTTARRRALEAADLLLCVSRNTRAHVLTHCDISPERAVVLNNTFDPRFTPGDRISARARFGLHEEFVLLTVGRLDSRERYKGHDRVISALHQLHVPKGRPVLYLIAGDGDDRPRLEAEADKAGVSDRVRFLGRVPFGILPDLYRSADMYVMPSTGEGFGISFIEAMACGTPAMGLAIGGATDALCEGQLGPALSPDQFHEAFASIFSDLNFDCETMHRFVTQRFGVEAFNSRVARTLERLIFTDR